MCINGRGPIQLNWWCYQHLQVCISGGSHNGMDFLNERFAYWGWKESWACYINILSVSFFWHQLNFCKWAEVGMRRRLGDELFTGTCFLLAYRSVKMLLCWKPCSKSSLGMHKPAHAYTSWAGPILCNTIFAFNIWVRSHIVTQPLGEKKMELFSNSFSVGESSGSCFEACVIDYHTFILKRRHNKESNMMFWNISSPHNVLEGNVRLQASFHALYVFEHKSKKLLESYRCS